MSWFNVSQFDNWLYVIRERLDLIDPRYYTIFTNLFLIHGDKAAILFDTGTGYRRIKPVVKQLIGDIDLIVINSHNHFDHVGGNHEFDETCIHRRDFKELMSPMDISFLKNSPHSNATEYAPNYQLTFAESNIPLVGDEVFDLGGIEVTLIHTPGHTPGSICMKSDKGHLFTGDTYQKGAVYLPSKEKIPYLLESLNEVKINAIRNDKEFTLFPGHEDYNIPPKEIDTLVKHIEKLPVTDPKMKDHFLQTEVYEFDAYTLLSPIDKTSFTN